MLNPVASVVLVASYLFFGLVITGLLGAVVFALMKLNARLDDLAGRLDPLLQKADDALTITTETVENLGSRVETVLAQGEATVESVHEKVDRTAHAVQHVVNAPIIRANSLLAGVTQGFSTFTRLQKRVPASKRKSGGEEIIGK